MVEGQTFSRLYQVSPDVYEGFITVFGDKNPLHTSTDYALEKGFAQRVMHGNILNGFISHFIGECLPIKEVMIYSQKIDYKKPVYLDDELTLVSVIEHVHESVNVVELSFVFLNRNQIEVAKGKIQIVLLK